MLTIDDKGGRGVIKHPKYADVIYEWSQNNTLKVGTSGVNVEQKGCTIL